MTDESNADDKLLKQEMDQLEKATLKFKEKQRDLEKIKKHFKNCKNDNIKIFKKIESDYEQNSLNIQQVEPILLNLNKELNFYQNFINYQQKQTMDL